MKSLGAAIGFLLLSSPLACGDDNGDCRADHAAEVTAGVPQAAIDTHCDAEFPPA